MGKIAIQAAKVFFSVTVLLAMQACAAHKELKTEYVGVQHRWDKDYKAKDDNVRNIELTDFSVREGKLHFSRNTHYVLEEYSFDRYQNLERTHHAPKWKFILTPVFGWFACLFDIPYCVGRTTGWYDAGYTDKNERPTGNIENKTKSGIPYGAILTGNLFGQSEAGELRSESETYYRSMNVKSIVQNWSHKPRTLTAQFTVQYRDEKFETVYHFTETQMASLELESDNWNSPKENKHKYFYRLTSALKAGKYTEALRAFKKMEEMDFEKPESFWYHYARSARDAGKHVLAAAKAERYLDVSVKRTYEAEAAAMLSGEK